MDFSLVADFWVSAIVQIDCITLELLKKGTDSIAGPMKVHPRRLETFEMSHSNLRCATITVRG